jgi:hypothetical protein
MEIDTLTREELRDELRGWMVEITRGVRFRTFAAVAEPAAPGAWTITEPRDQLGPAAGMIWAVTRIAVSGAAFTQGTDVFRVYLNDVSPAVLVAQSRQDTLFVDIGSLIVNPGDTLAFAGTAAAAGQLFVSGQAAELPAQLAWQLV